MPEAKVRLGTPDRAGLVMIVPGMIAAQPESGGAKRDDWAVRGINGRDMARIQETRRRCIGD